MEKEERLKKTKEGMIPWADRRAGRLRRFIEKNGKDRMDSLTEFQRYVIEKRIMRPPVTFDELAKERGTTRSSIKQAETRAIEKINKRIKEETFLW